jgi:hypothetical protein
VAQLGANAHGEVLEPGRVADCYLGLLLPPGPAGEPEAGTILVVGPSALLHPSVPQPAGSLVYELLIGHPEREPGELVFVADLTCELRAWPQDTWAKVAVDPDQAAQAIIGCWQDGEVAGLQVDDLGFEEARSRTRPAMTYVRGQLRGRLTARLARAHRRWLHPTSGRPPRRPVPVATTPAGDTGHGSVSAGVRNVGRHAGRPQRKCPAVAAAGPLLFPAARRGGHADRTPTMLTSLARAVACGSSGSGRVSGCAPHELPCVRGRYRRDHFVSVLVASGR